MSRSKRGELFAINKHIQAILCHPMTAVDKAVLGHLAKRRKELLNYAK